MAMHWRTLLHCALILAASSGLAGTVAIAPAQQPASTAPAAASSQQPQPQQSQQQATPAPAQRRIEVPPSDSSTLLLAAALANPASDRVLVPSTVNPGTHTPAAAQPELLPPGTFQEFTPLGESIAPVVPLGNPADPVDNLPTIMVPQSPFLPLATQPEPVHWLPVLSEPWSQRPLTAGMFTGVFWSDVAMDRHVKLDGGLIYGGRFGWDFDDLWGWEGRLGFASVTVDYPGTDIESTTGDAIFWDLQLHMSLFTRPRFKTYFALGAGMGYFDVLDHRYLPMTESVVTVPFGLGVKYRHDDWLVFRVDVADTLTLGKRTSGMSDIHSLSLLGALEIRFGGYQRDYWPWNLR